MINHNNLVTKINDDFWLISLENHSSDDYFKVSVWSHYEPEVFRFSANIEIIHMARLFNSCAVIVRKIDPNILEQITVYDPNGGGIVVNF